MSTHDGGFAFPQPDAVKNEIHNRYGLDRGMTLRDWFAGQALAGLLTEPGNAHAIVIPQGGREVSESLAADLAWSAYIIADAMLEARKAHK